MNCTHNDSNVTVMTMGGPNQNQIMPNVGNISNLRPGGMQGNVMTQNAQNAQNTSKQALQQLMKTLKNSPNPDSHQQILNILKSNPQLMSAFIKQRQQSQNQNNPNAQAAGNVPGNMAMMNQQQLPQQQQQQQQQAVPGQMGPRMQQMGTYFFHSIFK